MIPLSSSRQARALLRAARERKGLTQTELGRKLHVHYKTVNYREGGRVGIELQALIQHAGALGIRVALLRERPGSTGTGWPA